MEAAIWTLTVRAWKMTDRGITALIFKTFAAEDDPFVLWIGLMLEGGIVLCLEKVNFFLMRTV